MIPNVRTQHGANWANYAVILRSPSGAVTVVCTTDDRRLAYETAVYLERRGMSVDVTSAPSERYLGQ